MKDFQILPMSEADLPIISKYGALAFSTEALGEPWTKEKYIKHLKEVFNKEFSWVVKQEGEVVAGLVGFPAAYEKGEELFIDTIVVRKDKRGQGIGTALLKHAVEKVEEKGLAGIRFVTHPELKAYSWYQKLGYKKSGWIEMVKHFKD